MWSLSTKNEIDQAWNKQKEGLLWASIEGKTADGEIVTLAQVPGQDFCLFKWMAVASAPLRLRRKDLSQPPPKPIHRLIGMEIVMRNETIKVMETGHIFREPRTVEDKRFHYAAFGR